jgi:hypothetical protein
LTTKKEILALFQQIKRNYSFEVDQDKIDFWYKALKDYDFATLEENLLEHVKTNRFPPVIADLAKQPKKDDSFRPYYPGIEETKKILDGYQTDKPLTYEEIQKKKREILGPDFGGKE